MIANKMRLAWTCAAALGLAACGQTNTSPPSSPSSRAAAPAAMHSGASAQGCFVAAAEDFEALTEMAATASIVQLAQKTASAVGQARLCQPSLSGDQSARLDNVLGRLGQFETMRDRSALALASVEGYRIFVSAEIRPPGAIPIEVALLDYAGFRYQAGARSTPPLWSDMRQALDFANEQWRTLSPRISDEHLKTTFSANLAEMQASLGAADVVQARRAVSRELDGVDQLERFFSQRGSH